MTCCEWSKLTSRLIRNYSILYNFEPDNNPAITNAKTVSQANTFFIQTSLLYTNDKRQRMLRVHNYVIPASQALGSVYSNIDFQVLLAALVRKNITQYVSTRPLPDIQLDIINQFKKIFAGIAAQTPVSVQQELLPYLGLGFLGILKQPVFQAHYINNCELISQE